MSLISLLGAMITVYVNLNLKIATLDGKINENTIRIEMLEKTRVDDAKSIETVRTENRQEHMILSEKLDDILEKLN